MIWPWQRLALSECWEYDECLWIFDGEGESQDGWLSDWTRKTLFFHLNSLNDKNKILQRIRDAITLAEVCTLRVLLVFTIVSWCCVSHFYITLLFVYLFFIYLFVSWGSDKVSILTHAYPQKPVRKIKVVTYNYQCWQAFV